MGSQQHSAGGAANKTLSFEDHLLESFEDHLLDVVAAYHEGVGGADCDHAAE